MKDEKSAMDSLNSFRKVDFDSTDYNELVRLQSQVEHLDNLVISASPLSDNDVTKLKELKMFLETHEPLAKRKARRRSSFFKLCKKITGWLLTGFGVLSLIWFAVENPLALIALCVAVFVVFIISQKVQKDISEKKNRADTEKTDNNE